ncbi:histidine kinase [Spirosoma sp. KNUC1025]|uniref:sensor histidine kinase n=1 Tax=Spirosoma sp. KNUC1025 TaxID=2894082 RepID=UPI00386B42F8|nr:histidine kinase [Spirosoma sp. KNUC1025]
MRLAYLLPALLLITHVAVWAQSPLRLSFHHLTREEGLSNNNVISMLRDSRGFLWLGTFNGLNRFDGIECRVYKPTNSGIKGVHIANIIEDKTGDLWVGTDEGLFTYNRATDSFSLVASPSREVQFMASPYYVDYRGLIWVLLSGIKRSGLYTYNPAKKQYNFITDLVSEYLPARPKAPFGTVNTLYTGGSKQAGLYRLSLTNNRVTKVDTFFTGTKQPFKNRIQDYALEENDSIVWVTGNPISLTRLNTRTSQIRQYTTFAEKPIGQLTRGVLYRNWLLFGSVEGGIYLFDRQQDRFVQRIPYSPSRTDGLMANWAEIPYLDQNNNLFLSQLGFGVDYTNLTRINLSNWLTTDDAEQLGLRDNHVARVLGWHDQIWLTTQSEGVIVLDAQGQFQQQYKNKRALLADSKGRVWMLGPYGFDVLNPTTQKTTFLSVSKPHNGDSFLVEVGPGQYLFSTDGLYEIREQPSGKMTMNVVESLAKEKVIACHPMHYDATTKQLFLSANWWSDFYVLTNRQGKWEIKKKKAVPYSVYWIAPATDSSKLWLCTQKGLVLFDKQSFTHQLLTEKQGLPDNIVTNIIPEANGDHWLVTNRGISHYNWTRKEYKNFTSKDGANSKEYDWYGNFIMPDGRVVFGGNNGVTVIDPKANLGYSARPRVQITELYVNEQPFKTTPYIGETQEIELQPSQNTFALHAVGIDYGFPQKATLLYKLDGFDTQWIRASNPATARYTNLPAGTYTFLIKATDESGLQQSDIRKITVVVNAPFWRTAWFRAILIGLLGALAYLFYTLRTKQIRTEVRRKEEIQRIRTEAEINALRSQMNPHFIFNCMNTIDSYILLSKTDEASEFLQKFSRLIRLILENSRQEFISLDQELQTLELYIQLERERSNYKFDYEISADPALSKQDYQIPSMVLQPFVENAILHGLRHKKEDDGELFINLKINHDQLIARIIDNGIGRVASAQINRLRKQESHSVGVALTEERIQKLNEMYPHKAYLKINDIHIENDRGTVVEIGLPLLTLTDVRA